MSATKPVRIAFNMLCCATLFCWAKPQPRETISGLFGRKSWEYRRGIWRTGANLIDAMHPREPDHCQNTARCELDMRSVLGYHP